MDAKTVKISTVNYRMLCEYAGELQKEFGRPVSIDKTLSVLLKKGTLNDLAGSWKMSDKEAEAMRKSLASGWKRWKQRYV